MKLNEFNFLSKQGSKALQAYQAFALGDDQNEDSFMKKAKRRLRKYREATEQNVDKILESHDVDRDEFVFCSKELFLQLKSSKKKSPFSSDVSGFLNRLLGIKISSQNMILELYENVLRNVVSIDKQQGLFNDSIKQIGGKEMSLVNNSGNNIVYIDPITKIPTKHVRLAIERGMSWEEAKTIRDDAKIDEDDEVSGFYCSKSKWFGRDHYLLALKSSGDDVNSFTVWRPTSGKGSIELDMKSLKKRWKRLSDDSVVEKGWKQSILDAQERCIHGKKCKFGPDCDAGKPRRNVHLLCGVVTPILGIVESLVRRWMSSSNRRLGVVQASVSDNDGDNDSTKLLRLVGLRIPSQCSDKIIQQLRSLPGQKELRDELGVVGTEVVEEKEKSVEGKKKKIVEEKKKIADTKKKIADTNVTSTTTTTTKKRSAPEDIIDLCSPQKKKKREEKKTQSVVDLSNESPLRSKKEDVVEIDSDATLSEDEDSTKKVIKDADRLVTTTKKVIKDARQHVAEAKTKEPDVVDLSSSKAQDDDVVVFDLSKNDEEEEKKQNKIEDNIVDLSKESPMRPKKNSNGVKYSSQYRLVCIGRQFYFSEIKATFTPQNQQVRVPVEVNYSAPNGTSINSCLLLDRKSGLLYSNGGTKIPSIAYAYQKFSSLDIPKQDEINGMILCRRSVAVRGTMCVCDVLAYDQSLQWHPSSIRVILRVSGTRVFFGMTPSEACSMYTDGVIRDMKGREILSTPCGT